MAVEALRVDLERPSGVFYAGELIRGKLVLITRDDMTTRGVHVRLRGEAWTHWVEEGHGRDRDDYFGYKSYQDTRYTMFGNFFRTSVHREGGDSCEWGDAYGDGTMDIPMDAEEADEGLQIILRICHYKWGEQDEVLGETLLDLAGLALGGEEHTLPLTREGEAVEGTEGPPTVVVGTRLVPFETLVAQPGTRKRSTHMLELKVICARQLQSMSAHRRTDVYAQAYRAPRRVRTNRALPGPKKDAVLPLGRHIFPFALPLRMDAPGSCELSAGAYMRYHLYANVDQGEWRDPSVRIGINVIPNRPLPQPVLLQPVFGHVSGRIWRCRVSCFNCCKRGDYRMRVDLARQTYAPGEVVTFRADIVNDSNQTIGFVVRLRQRIWLQTSGRKESSSEETNLFGVVGKKIPKERSIVISGESLQAKLPDVPPSFFGAPGSRAAHRDPLKITYVLEFHLGRVHHISANPVVTIPIFVPPAAPFADALPETPEEPTEAVEGARGWDMEHRVQIGLGKTKYFPALRTEEDLGDFAEIVPLGNRAPIRDLEEDVGSLMGDDELTYQPYSVRWQSLAPAEEAMDASELDSEESREDENPANGADDAAPQDATIVAAQTAATPKEGPVPRLLRTLSIGDRRTVVRQWIRAYPKHARRLSPAVVREVLEEVPYAMEQPGVACDLAAALSGRQAEGLTCAHVRAAMEAAPFAAGEVAMTMISLGLSDPWNRGDILDLLPPSEQRRVEDGIIEEERGQDDTSRHDVVKGGGSRAGEELPEGGYPVTPERRVGRG